MRPVRDEGLGPLVVKVCSPGERDVQRGGQIVPAVIEVLRRLGPIKMAMLPKVEKDKGTRRPSELLVV